MQIRYLLFDWIELFRAGPFNDLNSLIWKTGGSGTSRIIEGNISIPIIL